MWVCPDLRIATNVGVGISHRLKLFRSHHGAKQLYKHMISQVQGDAKANIVTYRKKKNREAASRPLQNQASCLTVPIIAPQRANVQNQHGLKNT